MAQRYTWLNLPGSGDALVSHGLSFTGEEPDCRAGQILADFSFHLSFVLLLLFFLFYAFNLILVVSQKK